MAVCKTCPTILRSGNETGYCSVCAPPDKHEDTIIHTPFFPYAKAGEAKQWDRLLIKILIEVACVFGVTVTELEKKSAQHSAPYLAVQYLIADFFRVSLSDVVRFGKLSREDIAKMRYEAEVLHRHDGGFREKYKKVRTALETIDRDILPKCVDPAVIPLREETDEEYKLSVRFTRTVARPVDFVQVSREANT